MHKSQKIRFFKRKLVLINKGLKTKDRDYQIKKKTTTAVDELCLILEKNQGLNKGWFQLISSPFQTRDFLHYN